MSKSRFNREKWEERLARLQGLDAEVEWVTAALKKLGQHVEALEEVDDDDDFEMSGFIYPH